MSALEKNGVLPEPVRPRDTGNRPRALGNYEDEWERCTIQAQKLFVQISRNRIHIAKLALEVCDVQHGGGNHWSGHKGIKTLKDFAEDTSINLKTLYSYVDMYRHVYQKLEYARWDDRNYGAGRRTLARVQGIKNASEETVDQIYQEEKKRNGSKSRIFIINKNFRTVRNHLDKIDFSICSKQEVETMKELLDECIDRINTKA